MSLYTGRVTVPMYSFSAHELFDGPNIDVQTRAMAEIVAAHQTRASVTRPKQ